MSKAIAKASRITDWLDQLDSAIRAGDTAKAREAISDYSYGSLGIIDRVRFSHIARRLHMPMLAIRALRPHLEVSPDPHALAAYSAALVSLGAWQEGIAICRSLDPNEVPETQLFEAFHWISCWEYEKATPLLERFSRQCASAYDLAVTQLNLASSYLFQGLTDLAVQSASSIIENAQPNYTLIRANSLGVRAQAHIERREWERARADLTQASRLLQDESRPDLLVLHKWRAIVEIEANSGYSQPHLEALEAVKKLAVAQRHFETIRDIDRYLAVKNQDGVGQTRIYFGTPFEGFRKKLFRSFSGKIEIPSEFRWVPSGRVRPRRLLRLSDMDDKKSKQILQKLSSDFYRPQSWGCLFTMLYPDERVLQQGAAARVHQAVRETRKMVQKYGVLITRRGHNYFIDSATDTAIVVEAPTARAPDSDDEMSVLKQRLGHDYFSANEARCALNVSRTTTLRVLTKAVGSGLLERIGVGGPGTQYRFRK